MTRTLSPSQRRGAPDDAGFTLIEVVVALFLLGIVSTAILLFFVKGVQTSAHLQRTQAANGVATAAIEKVRAVTPLETASLSAMVKGRNKDDAKLVWDAAAAIDTANTTLEFDPTAAHWDPVADPTGGPVLRLRTVENDSGIKYTVTTLIGSCYRTATLSGTAATCVKTKVGAAVKIYRVTVVVTWKPTTQDQCDGAGTCTYRTSILIDPNQEAAWNLTTKPVAYDDAIPALVGGPREKHDILANDVIGAVTSNPVTLTVPATPPLWKLPAPAIITSGVEMGMLDYTPPVATSGLLTMSYKLKDAAGRTSNDADIVVAVHPVALPDTATVAFGASVVIDAGANDLGTFAASKDLNIETPPSSGTVVVGGGKITYTPPATGVPSSTSFQYSIGDTSALRSAAVTVTVARTAPVALVAANFARSMTTGATSVALDLDVLGANSSSPAGSTIKIIAGPVGADGWMNPGSVTGDGTGSVKYLPVAKAIGFYVIDYQIQYPGRPSSPTARITVSVSPFLMADDPAVSKNNSVSVGLGGNDLPGSGMTYAINESKLAGCGTVTSFNASTGVLVFKAGNKKATCYTTYTASKSGTPAIPATSFTVTQNVSVTVTN